VSSLYSVVTILSALRGLASSCSTFPQLALRAAFYRRSAAGAGNHSRTFPRAPGTSVPGYHMPPLRGWILVMFVPPVLPEIRFSSSP
jgi:hypothetical protein